MGSFIEIMWTSQKSVCVSVLLMKPKMLICAVLKIRDFIKLLRLPFATPRPLHRGPPVRNHCFRRLILIFCLCCCNSGKSCSLAQSRSSKWIRIATPLLFQNSVRASHAPPFWNLCLYNINRWFYSGETFSLRYAKDEISLFDLGDR